MTERWNALFDCAASSCQCQTGMIIELWRSRKAALILTIGVISETYGLYSPTICWTSVTNDACESCWSFNAIWALLQEWKGDFIKGPWNKTPVFNLDCGFSSAVWSNAAGFYPQNKITTEQTRLLRPALARHPLQALRAIFQNSVVWCPSNLTAPIRWRFDECPWKGPW